MDRGGGSMKGKEEKTLRSRYTHFVLLILVLVLSMYLFSNIQSFSFWVQYRNTFTQFEELSHFYSDVKSMNFSIKNFIYSHDQKEYSLYKQHLKAARASLNTLMGAVNFELRFRYGLLNNMLKTYEESVAEAISINFDLDYQTLYDHLDRLAYLVDETYSQYALLATNEMNHIKERMLHRWQSQLILTYPSS